MNNKYHIINASIVNEGEIFKGDIIIENGLISKIIRKRDDSYKYTASKNTIIINAQGKYLFPGVIDSHVHFREPGLNYKADIYTESKAAVAGGTTSFMEMPNTIPNVLTQKLLEEKYSLASKKSLSNYSFFMGASNDNIEELIKTNPRNVCGIKVFMGSSTGNMLVNDIKALNKIFLKSKLPVAVHCEDDNIIKKNTESFRKKYGDSLTSKFHPLIRSRKACYKSSELAVKLAKKYKTHLHILHLTTSDELGLLDNSIPLKHKKITAEVCINYLFFNDNDYKKYGTLIKVNPAIKTAKDQKALLKALLDDKIDSIATDHAPHLLKEKNNPYLIAPSGTPNVQHSLVAMLDLYHQGKISLNKIVEKMCHSPAIIYHINKRGFIRENYFADLLLVDLNNPWKVDKSNILYKCKWSPFQGHTFKSKITHTFVNGNLVYNNGIFDESYKGQRLLFDR